MKKYSEPEPEPVKSGPVPQHLVDVKILVAGVMSM